MDRAYTLLGVLLDHAPDRGAQEIVTSIYHDMQCDHVTPRDMEVQLVGAIYDGLRYGNWPWAKTIRIK